MVVRDIGVLREYIGEGPDREDVTGVPDRVILLRVANEQFRLNGEVGALMGAHALAMARIAALESVPREKAVTLPEIVEEMKTDPRMMDPVFAAHDRRVRDKRISWIGGLFRAGISEGLKKGIGLAVVIALGVVAGWIIRNASVLDVHVKSGQTQVEVDHVR